ncbi:Transposase, IS5 ssgr, IS427 family [Photorhabdus laumondii subsp. laumondii TTO1]|uniref:Transposase, IS5 ssgr, IS427 family n=1 Tax=Photorhabdus laumondii subsp. laumondii (strain DSM 15139 / CIP 105565 / TT01) TaxID=243265 RepID=Q7M7G5_PHOLL|nr:Transposase, IS5 ssgr, IS427 family [Photorhabdus laumondii subsp. laumondii TTO1]CAE15697.1 Transposase, IS5 ssgr, IS427 family [Photorhabdus laumondii subsp. laumondii TTO1]CAE15784.1 Transposase, IS5 ssgr, IS427 family [Photorhabdus laumondii subsp. laumondii TTO1]CAE16890.1 Transposase, IS5 ssgr, IS427 family [Photorhabdus laumondii subsp. laumondii TTO1]
MNVVLSAGQCHESQYAVRLLDGLGIQRKNGFMKRRSKAVIADKGYASHALRNRLKSQGIKVIIPYKSNEKARSDGRVKFDHETYRRRNVVERCFGRLKEHRRIATRYEKTARNYIAMVKLGCIRLFLKAII